MKQSFETINKNIVEYRVIAGHREKDYLVGYRDKFLLP